VIEVQFDGLGFRTSFNRIYGALSFQQMDTSDTSPASVDGTSTIAPPRAASPAPSATPSTRSSLTGTSRTTSRLPASTGEMLTNRELRQRESTKILFDDAVQKVARLYAAELQSLGEDYRLVGQQCLVAREQYAQMSEDAQELIGKTHELNQAVAKVPAFLDQIDTLDKEVAHLEAVRGELGEYIKKLENYAKKLSR